MYGNIPILFGTIGIITRWPGNISYVIMGPWELFLQVWERIPKSCQTTSVIITLVCDTLLTLQEFSDSTNSVQETCWLIGSIHGCRLVVLGSSLASTQPDIPFVGCHLGWYSVTGRLWCPSEPKFYLRTLESTKYVCLQYHTFPRVQ
jgi:hypothetical protein